MYWMYALLLMGSLVCSEPSKPATLNKESVLSYTAKDFQHLKGMEGFSSALLDLHFTLYQGYVKNTNLILQELEQLENSGKMRSYDYGALKRRLGWEFDGMRLHELYFENLGGSGGTNQ
jgi:Fe-Mn family superoxide dismutase